LRERRPRITDMLVKCPRCNTLNPVDEKSLARDAAMSRCSHCGTTFNARLYIPVDALPPRLRIGSMAAISPAAAQEPSGAAPENERSRRGTLGWLTGTVLLTIVLASQYGYFNHTHLSRYLILRPWLEQLCRYTGCELPLLRDGTQLRILARNIHAHPQVPGALLVTLTIGNDARYTQAFPDLRLSFYDLNHTLLAERRFSPREYLPTGVKTKSGLPPRQPFQVQLEIIDPGPAAVNFEFAFVE
jgi:predicted Zn finger-like uncharacterized protein